MLRLLIGLSWSLYRVRLEATFAVESSLMPLMFSLLHIVLLETLRKLITLLCSVD